MIGSPARRGAAPVATIAPGHHPLDSPLARNLANFVLFQLVWFACVLWAAQGHPTWGVAAGAALLPLNLVFVPAGHRAREVLLWLGVGVLGFALDSGLHTADLVGFPDHALPSDAAHWQHLAPPWIVVLWVAVGTMLRSSLRWLHHRLGLAALLGAVGGPLSFWSGVRLDATLMPAGVASVAALSIEYAVVFPILLAVARDRVPPPSEGAGPDPIEPARDEVPTGPAPRSDAP